MIGRKLVFPAVIVLALNPGTTRSWAGDAANLQRAQQLMRQQQWAEARAAFDEVGRASDDCHAPAARQAMQGVFTCLLRLHDWESAWARVAQFRKRERASPVGRERWSHWRPETPEAKAARRAVEHYEFVRGLYLQLAEAPALGTADPAARRLAELTTARIELDFTVVQFLLGADFDQDSWGRPDMDWWWDATDKPEPDEHEETHWWSYSYHGLPLGADGRPRFLKIPAHYSGELGSGAKILYLLNEIQSLDATPTRDQAARALLRRAQIARRLYGPSSDGSWESAESYYAYAYRPSFLKSYRGNRVKPFWELADNEARTLVAGRAQVVELPETESPLALLHQIEYKYPRSSSVPEAIFLRGRYYQSRQQFDQALREYQTLRKAFPKHARSAATLKPINAIRHADVLLGQTGISPAGSKPTLWFAHRQTGEIEFTARRLDLARFLRTDPQMKSSPWTLHHSIVGFLPSGRWSDDEEQTKRVAPYLGKETIRWSEKVLRAERITTQQTLAPVTDVGAYLVEAGLPGEKPVSRALVILTDLVLVYKQTADKSLIYVADAQTGRPAHGQEVGFFTWEAGKSRELAYKTNQEGIIEAPLKGGYELVALAISRKGGVAATDFRLWDSPEKARRRTGYAVTDRPVYRPGDTVHFRLWIRDLVERKYQRPREGDPVKVEIHDPQGNLGRVLTLRTDRDGGVTGELPLSQEAALGSYTISSGQLEHGDEEVPGQFRVEMYKKPEFEITVQPVERLVRPGAGARMLVQAHYYFGGPVAAGQVYYRVFRERFEAPAPPQPYDWLYGPGYEQSSPRYPWLDPTSDRNDSFEDGDERNYRFEDEWWDLIRSGEATLSADGAVEIGIDTKNLGPSDQRLTVEVEVRDASRRTIRGKGSAVVACRDLTATVEMDRGWYSPDSQPRVDVRLFSAGGQGVGAKGSLRLERVRDQGPAKQEVRTEVLQSWLGVTNTSGHLSQQLPHLPEGQYRIEFRSRDARYQEAAARAVFWVHGPRFEGRAYRHVDLEILTDRRTYRIGDTARLLIHTAQPNARVLWSDDARDGKLHRYRFLDIPEHVAVIPIHIEARHVPNFFVEATVVSGGKVHVEACEVLVPPVQDLLQVLITPDRADYRPGETGAVRVAVTDAAGKPVSGRLALTAYDKSVTYIQDESGKGPNVLIAKRKYEHDPDRGWNSAGWKLEAEGTFVCPEFEIYDGGHRSFGMLGGSPPQGGDVTEGIATLPQGRRPQLRGPQRPGEPVIRRNFADTAVWQAALQLAPDGTATTRVHWPQSLTTWRLRAYAVTETTQVGDGTAQVVTSKHLLVRLQTPRFLVEGDAVVLSANVHNALPRDQRVAAELIVPAALFRATQAKAGAAGNLHLRAERTVKAGGTERFDWPLQVLQPGAAIVTVKALAETESDAMQVTLPILAHGIRQEEARAGIFQPGESATQTTTFTLPRIFDAAQTRLEVNVAHGPVGPMLDALPMLIGYPYGCTEQTMSRFYPTVIAANALKKLGIKLETLAQTPRGVDPKLAGRFHHVPAAVYDSAELGRIAEAGLDRLYNFQHQDGGWGWWQDDTSSPHMTAYVLMGLQLTQQAGLEVRPHALDRGYFYLFRAIDSKTPSYARFNQEEGPRVEAYLAYVLSWAAAHKGEPGGLTAERLNGERILLTRLLDRLFRQRRELNAYGLSLLALALHDGKEDGRSREVLQDLMRLIRQDKTDGTASVDARRHGWWHWWNSDVETNAWVLRALVRLDPQNHLTSRLARWLVLHRHNGTFWRSTRDSALAVAALADYLVVQKASTVDGRVVLRLNGKVVREIALRPEQFLTPAHSLVLDVGQLAPGPHTLTLEKTGRGEVYYASRLQTFANKDIFQASGKGLALKREYFVLAADGSRRRPLTDGASVAVGELVEVRLMIDAAEDYDYLAFEDPKPAGCEPIQIQSGGMVLDWTWANVELHDQRLAFFIPYLHKGQHVLRYRLRAETPGNFRVLPATGFAMYAPEIQANGAGFKLKIEEK